MLCMLSHGTNLQNDRYAKLPRCEPAHANESTLYKWSEEFVAVTEMKHGNGGAETAQACVLRRRIGLPGRLFLPETA